MRGLVGNSRATSTLNNTRSAGELLRGFLPGTSKRGLRHR